MFIKPIYFNKLLIKGFTATFAKKKYHFSGLGLPVPNKLPKDLQCLLKQCWKTVPGKRPTFDNILERFETLKKVNLSFVKVLRFFACQLLLELVKIQISDYFDKKRNFSQIFFFLIKLKSILKK